MLVYWDRERWLDHFSPRQRAYLSVRRRHHLGCGCEDSAVPAGGGRAPESPPGALPGQQKAQAALQTADRSSSSCERRRCRPCTPATQKIGTCPSPVVFSSSISRCTFYFRESFSIINGATLNMPQTNQIPPSLGQSTRRSHGIPKTETSYSM